MGGLTLLSGGSRARISSSLRREEEDSAPQGEGKEL